MQRLKLLPRRITSLIEFARGTGSAVEHVVFKRYAGGMAWCSLAQHVTPVVAPNNRTVCASAIVPFGFCNVASLSAAFSERRWKIK